jgi:aminoglycoside phosphotransferase (APT) family kinase protein
MPFTRHIFHAIDVIKEKISAEYVPISSGTPKPEVEISEELIRDLLEDQHTDLAKLPLQYVGDGWDNAMYRLGDKLAIRLPRREFGAPLIDNEQKWLPVLAERLPIPVPVPYRFGEPGRGFPWRWSIVPWLPGVPANEHEPDPKEAARLGKFLRALHTPTPSDAPTNEMRGIPLIQRAEIDAGRLERIEEKTNFITDEIKTIWEEALKTPIDVESRWLHGDLHPRNILVEGGTITGIIDWGDMNSGDIATDLASVWMLFKNTSARQQALEAYGPISEPSLLRAKGWAVLFGVLLLGAGLVDDSIHAEIGRKALERVAQDA